MFTLVPGESVEVLELTLPLGARIFGRLNFPDDVGPIAWYVQPDRPDDENWRRATIPRSLLGTDGSFDTGTLAAGRVRLLLFRPGSSLAYDLERGWIGGRLLEELVLENGQDLERSYAFPGVAPSSVTFEIRVDGFETDFAMVILFPDDLQSPLSPTPGPLTGSEPILLPPGRYGVEVFGYGWAFLAPEPITIVAQEAKKITLTAPLLSHRVRLVQAGEPVASRGVMISQAAGRRELRVSLQTDAEGWVDIRLAAGAFEFRLHQLGEHAERDTTVTWPLPGGTSEIDLD